MAHVTRAEVQSWLDEDILELPENDQFPEDENLTSMVYARLASTYDTATWVNETTTPDAVRSIISALIAANRYNRVHSEEEDAGNRYANKLEGRAWDLVERLVNGSATLVDVVSTSPSTNNPVFWPTDISSGAEVLDALGNVVGYEGDDDVKFRMSMRF